MSWWVQHANCVPWATSAQYDNFAARRGVKILPSEDIAALGSPQCLNCAASSYVIPDTERSVVRLYVRLALTESLWISTASTAACFAFFEYIHTPRPRVLFVCADCEVGKVQHVVGFYRVLLVH